MKTGKKSKSIGKTSKEKNTQEAKEETNKKGTTSKAEEKGKSKKKNNKGEEDKKDGEKKKKISSNFNLDFIFRREKYTLNLLKKILVSKMKEKIAEKIQIEGKNLKFYYHDKELTKEDDQKVIFEMIKDDPVPFIDVKKELEINQNIISLNTKVNLVYKVRCTPITSYIDFVNIIEQFFKDICLEKHYLCEPIKTDAYDVCFSCSDHCFQFKRYMMNISRTDKLYEKTTFKILPVDKSKVIEPKIEAPANDILENEVNKIEKMEVFDKKSKKNVQFEYRKIKHKENDYFQKEFINVGPYESYEDIKKKEEKNDKKNWISKKKFSVV